MCFYNGDAEAPEFYVDDLVRARKEHRCTECGKAIRPRRMYRRIRAKWDGEIQTLRQCARCMMCVERVRAYEIAEGCSPDEAVPLLGGLSEEVWNAYDAETARRLLYRMPEVAAL